MYFVHLICVWFVSGFIGLSVGAAIEAGNDNKIEQLGFDLGGGDECLKYAGPIEITSNAVSETKNFFEPFRFRANNYGLAQYELESTFMGSQILNIKMDAGPRPDTLSGGDLKGFYAFYRTFLVPRDNGNPSQIRFGVGNMHGLEVWHVYLLKNTITGDLDSLVPRLISLNVLFEIGNKSNIGLTPILTALQKLSSTKSSVPLRMNYDPYVLMPLQGSFVVYETSFFPFPHPFFQQTQNPLSKTTIKNKKQNSCDRLVKVYLFGKRLTMSEIQLKEFLKHGPVPPTNYDFKLSTQINPNVKVISHSPPKIYFTPQAKHLIFRRMVDEATVTVAPEKEKKEEKKEGDEEAYDIYEEEKEEEEPEPEIPKPKSNISNPIETDDDEYYFPPDCAYLYRMQDIRYGKYRPRNDGSSLSFTFLPTILTVLLGNFAKDLI